MRQKLYKILLILGMVLVLTAVPIFWLNFEASGDLEIDFFDVGQGDAIFIKTPMGQNILIDGGPDDKIIDRLSENLAWWDKQIDLMVLTHPHSDHVAGLVDVINRYKVKKILYTGVIHDSPDYLTWLELIRDRGIPLVIIDRPQTVKLGEDCYLDISHPLESMLGKEVPNLNNSSIVVKLIYKETKFLFTGDIESEVEQELLEYKVDLSADVLKTAHHGSDTSGTLEFLTAVNPRIAIIQVGAENDFGHPSLRVVKRLERMGVKIFRNDLDGTVKLISDGENISHNP
ncbi:MBL fold metallo-hydrolase [Patescibacteria group bacterium]|nr:MBL fold metallo-hydrolase [Candidatus Falkowbacteria bacterium]MBU3906238.1 MBL fold metallo-hydrolase [Patescibacteria group bacterium]MBU4014580.1 MBL fold metallo-hydrolase [Patescibacteria group bacterium]MBU4026867.1 MBL fold metallo-hydrolase [Patescibacteria group bacterium]MBU4073431.1 MBL fold metallo-hydrolase [Patescibacteria group bacterium]